MKAIENKAIENMEFYQDMTRSESMRFAKTFFFYGAIYIALEEYCDITGQDMDELVNTCVGLYLKPMMECIKKNASEERWEYIMRFIERVDKEEEK